MSDAIIKIAAIILFGGWGGFQIYTYFNPAPPTPEETKCLQICEKSFESHLEEIQKAELNGCERRRLCRHTDLSNETVPVWSKLEKDTLGYRARKFFGLENNNDQRN